jgi:hypothetical protein
MSNEKPKVKKTQQPRHKRTNISVWHSANAKAILTYEEHRCQHQNHQSQSCDDS